MHEPKTVLDWYLDSLTTMILLCCSISRFVLCVFFVLSVCFAIVAGVFPPPSFSSLSLP